MINVRGKEKRKQMYVYSFKFLKIKTASILVALLVLAANNLHSWILFKKPSTLNILKGWLSEEAFGCEILLP